MEKRLPLPEIKKLTSLDEAKETINALIRIGMPTIRYALGAYFTDVRDLCEHGDWQKWVDENVEFVKYRTAAAYMEYFRRCQEAGYLVRYSKSASSAVLKAIASPPDYPEEE